MAENEKERLDVRMVALGLAASREKAKAYIQDGIVYVDGKCAGKAGQLCTEQNQIEIRGQVLRYVSRGGLKLEKALAVFEINLYGKTCMDVGASTGGFTDCMLQNGAERVYAVDVGTSQLAASLRNDARVISIEQTNIRGVRPEELPESMDFVSIDVSFISLQKVLYPVKQLMKQSAEMVCLVKPQFEAGKDKVGKKGVVKEPSVHLEVAEQVIRYADSIGFLVEGFDYSPIRGPEGNIEYLLYLKNCEERPEEGMQAENAAWLLKLDSIIRESHRNK